MSEDPAAPLRLKDLAVQDRPQERLARLGAAALSDTELLAMLLRSGSRGQNVLALAQHLLATAGSLGALIRWTPADFRRLRGIGPVKALQLVAVMETARRQRLLHDLRRLNRRNRLLRQVEITSGTATSSLVHPREVFREAIREGATAILCAHNHPSGDPAPSAADVQVTRQLREAGRAVDIDLLDHLILGLPALDPKGLGWYSFRQAGLL